MNQLNDLRKHPLFDNRQRVMAVPAAAKNTQPPAQKMVKLVLLNLLVAGLVAASFGIGVWFARPEIITAFGGMIGQKWTELVVHGFGSGTGNVLATQSPWIMARVGGILAYLLLFASVAYGLANKLRLLDNFMTRAQVMYLHRFVSLLAIIFTVVHVVGLLLDTYLQFSPGAILIPFTATYRPLWTALGTLAIYGAIAVALTAYYGGRIGYKVWRTIHYASFGIFAATFVHGLMAGSDSKSLWMQVIYLVTGGIVAFLTGIRFFNQPAKTAKKPARKTA
ncbi:MAG TPA: ferric reductase-like transmembrane domain-containing protein [Chloroflexia bacterium]|nr:ferric reductase-like transmembrane domain-containing protein [Chloroflexia bacterium]